MTETTYTLAQAVTAAVDAMEAETRRFLDLGYQMPPTYSDMARAALAAAASLLRESIAQEIKAYAESIDASDDRLNENEWQLLTEAARIARTGSR